MKNGVKFIQHNLVCVKNKMLFYLNIFRSIAGSFLQWKK